MNKVKKIAMLGAVATMTLVGCSQAKEEVKTEVVTSTNGQEASLIMWHAMSGALGETLAEIVEDFNASIGAEKHIKVEALYQGSYDDLKSKLTASVKSNNAPHIIQGTSTAIMELMQSPDTVVPLDDYIYHDEIGIADYDTDIYEVFKEEVTAFTESREIFAIPFAKSTDLYFYNKTFFEENGLEVPTTWEELEEVSRQIHELTGKPAFGVDNLTNYFVTQLFQNEAGYTNEEGEILFNNETAEAILERLKANVDAGIWRIGGEDVYHSGPFLSQNVYSYIGSSAGSSYLHDENFSWASAPIPQANPEKSAYIQQGNLISVLNQSGRTSEELYASYEFVKYLLSPEVVLKWSSETGYLPVRQSVTESEAYQAMLIETNDRVKANAAKSIENSFIEAMFVTDHSTANLVRNEVGVMIEEILLKDEPIKDTLIRYEEKLTY